MRYYLPDVSDVTLPRIAQVVSNPAVADLTPASAWAPPPASSATSSTAAPAALTSERDHSGAGARVTSSSAAARSTAAGGEQPGGASTGTTTSASAGARVWQVTVGVDVEEPGPQGNVVVRRYFAVPVVYVPAQPMRPATLRSVSLPGPVAAPTAGEGLRSSYQDGLPVTGAVGSSVQAFLSAYLTDRGDVTRLLSPRAVGITPVRPVAYTQAQLRILKADRRDVDNGQPADGERIDVFATAILTGLDTQARSAQFALTLTARGGRWEINQVHPAPLVDASTSASTQQPGTDPPTDPG